HILKLNTQVRCISYSDTPSKRLLIHLEMAYVQCCSISLRKQRNIAAVSVLSELPTVHSERSRRGYN
uniref:Uncharacterized protein n=1 Tax=Parascaris univalens TaxID=6257 RepID=A0A915ADS0_PARUN